MIPGETIPAEGNLEFNRGRPGASLTITNTGDRPITVGSHFHFFEANKALKFDREKAYGMHMDKPAGAYALFEPGEEHEIDLVAYAGARVVHGFNGLVEGPLDDPETREAAFRRAREEGFMDGVGSEEGGG